MTTSSRKTTIGVLLAALLLGSVVRFVSRGNDAPPLVAPDNPGAKHEPTAVIDMLVTAEMRGRVVDARGMAVAATVTAFRERDGVHVSIGSTDVGADGAWRLRVLPDEALLLVAQPIGHGPLDVLQRPPYARGAFVRRTKATDLLPAIHRATCKADDAAEVPDLVLVEASELQVFASWSDGAPIVGAHVQLLPRVGEALRIADGSFVHRQVDGRVTTTSCAVTDSSGGASLPMLAGARAEVELFLPFVSRPANLVQPVTDTAVEFRIPRPVTLRAMAGGKQVFGASFAVQGRGEAESNSNGTSQMMVDAPLRVRASREDRLSPWIDMGTEAAGRTIDLELARGGLREVRITLDGLRASFVRLEWRAADGTSGTREDFCKPGWRLPLWLPPGRCTVRVGSPSVHGVLFPAEVEVDVGDDTPAVTIPVREGAGIIVHAKDDSGWYFAGTCRIVAANGDDVTDTFVIQRDLHQECGARGEILVGGPNRLSRVLPAGEYELRIDILGRGARRERVTLREGEIANVVVRL